MFRKTGNVTRQRLLKQWIHDGADLHLNDATFSPHDVATVLKQLLSDLPEPLLTQKHYEAHKQIVGKCSFLTIRRLVVPPIPDIIPRKAPGFFFFSMCVCHSIYMFIVGYRIQAMLVYQDLEVCEMQQFFKLCFLADIGNCRMSCLSKQVGFLRILHSFLPHEGPYLRTNQLQGE